MHWVFLKHKKIRLIKDLNLLNNSQYVEFATGEFNDKYWQENSVFIQDEIFPLIEQAFYETDSEIAENETLQITSQSWISISENLDILKKLFEKAKSNSDIESLLIYISDDIRESFAESFNEAKNETLKLIDDLSEWIGSNLEKYETVSIIGV